MSRRAPMPLSTVIREWDGGSRTRRLQLLTDFLVRHRDSTAAEIETDLGHGAMLFFTRITAWLRLTYRLGQELAVALSALSLFLQGQKYLTNFMEIGGIQMLTELVAQSGHQHPMDKENSLLLLIHIANAGRVYREMICDGEGIHHIASAAMKESNERVLELCGQLFTALGQGNPRKASSVHAGLLLVMHHGTEGGALAAATALRSLQLTKMAHGSGPSFGVAEGGGEDPAAGGASANAVLDAVFHILSSPNVKLRFEGMELLTIAAHHPNLVLAVLRRCFEALERADISIDEDPAEASRQERLKASCGRVLCTVLQLPPTSEAVAERAFMLVQRHSGHITLSRFLVACAGRDVPGQIECCKALRLLCLGPFGAFTTDAAAAHFMGAWVREAVGPALFEEWLAGGSRDAEISEALALKVTQAISHHLAQARTPPLGPKQPRDVGDDDAFNDEVPMMSAATGAVGGTTR